MADSDGEFVAEMSDDDYQDHQVTSSSRSAGRRKGKKGANKNTKAAWENVKRSWDTVVESQDGTLKLAPYLDAEKRKRLMRDTTPLQRGIIRHVMLVVDMSFAMAEKDMLPTRYRLAIGYAKEFVREYFEQNPISQMGVVGMKDGVAVRVSHMGGNPAEHLERLEALRDAEASGNPSLQNALEMCRGALFNTPSHGTREVVMIYGALLSSDPGDIHDTIASLIQDRIRVSIIGLAAQVAICAELCKKTNGGDDSHYNVAMHEQHFRELLLDNTTPPATRTEEQNTASLLMMGFPSRTLAPADTVSYCACHNKPVREGYLCTRCNTRVCRLPADCPACDMTLILSTHLARSYHHLMPLKNFNEVSWEHAARTRACFSCLAPFPHPPRKAKEKHHPVVKGVSESGRYACSACGNHFCIDCDVFCHETIHNCPGCEAMVMREAEQANGDRGGNSNGAMVVD